MLFELCELQGVASRAGNSEIGILKHVTKNDQYDWATTNFSRT
jgi:hypothetical protein